MGERCLWDETGQRSVGQPASGPADWVPLSLGPRALAEEAES